jgi:hypothetical protein
MACKDILTLQLCRVSDGKLKPARKAAFIFVDARNICFQIFSGLTRGVISPENDELLT